MPHSDNRIESWLFDLIAIRTKFDRNVATSASAFLGAPTLRTTQRTIPRVPTLTAIETLETRLAPFREELLNHPVYGEIDRLEALRKFMEQHIFAVWDFMSLLKALQRHVCSVNVPWLPPSDPQACRFVNEIVLAEESDGDSQVGFASHFDLYLRSMQQCGANTSCIESFILELRKGNTVRHALAAASVPAAARTFVEHTFSVIESGNLCAIASAFTFGREDLLPDVFQRIIDELNVEVGGQLEQFKYYLERHIGLDGDEHGPMARRLVASLCGANEQQWKTAEDTAVNCLIARRKLWDGIYEVIASPCVAAPENNA